MKKAGNIRILIYTAAFPVLLLSLLIGPSENISLHDGVQWLLNMISGNDTDTFIQTIILQVRLPRVLTAFLVGGALSISGNSLQAIFRNPLVSPYILGLSNGAAFGAALALATGLLPLQLSAFIFGLIAVIISYLAARKHKEVSIVSLILSGIIVTGIFTALLTIVQFLSDPFKLQSIVHWTMGNLQNSGWQSLTSMLIPLFAGVILLLSMRWKMNVYALGDEEAKTSGLNPEWGKILILIAASLASSSAVAVAGVIGLYGLFVPHIVRMLSGPDNLHSTPLNFVFGGTFLLIIDDFSRTISSFEIPIGVITMLLGAPFFLFLMKKNKIGWEN